MSTIRADRPPRRRPADEQWEIQRIVPGGDGFAELADGRFGFASGALPGDRIRVRELSDHKSWRRALRWELVGSGPNRVAPPCPLAEICGGCDLMHLERKAELASKVALVREALTRTGRFFDLPEELPIVTAGGDLAYRSRLRLHVDEGGRFGLFERQSHRLVELEACPVSNAELERGLSQLREIAGRHPRALAEFSELEIRAAPAGPALSIWLKPRVREETSAKASALLTELATRFAVAVHGEDRGAQDQRFPLPGGLELFAPPGAFTQVNWEVNQLLVSAVLDGAKSRALESFVDLYCGAGNFTLPLLRAGLSGFGVDHAGSAIRAARRAARAAGLDPERFVDGDVKGKLSEIASRIATIDLVVLDPPRTGAREVLGEISAAKPRAIAFSSCDPVTLARDLRVLAAAGYAIESVTCFDMFPHTHHVEVLVWLVRR